MEPQVLTITAWYPSQAAVERLAAKHGEERRSNPIALMAMNSINLKTTTLCHMGAFILRELGKNLGLERASEIVFQTATTMTMKAQFRTGPEQPPPFDPATEYGDERPEWEKEDREPREEDFENGSEDGWDDCPDNDDGFYDG